MAFCFPLDKLAQGPYDVATWHLLLLLPQWCFVLPLHGKAIGHNEMQIQLKCFLASGWKNLHEFIFLQAQALMASLNLMLLPQHDLLAHKHLLHNLVFRRAHEYF